MRFALMAAVTILTLQAASRAGEDSFKVDRNAFNKVANGIDNRFRDLWPEYPAELIGVTHIVYIRGYGAVLTGELNLAPMGGITPFHQTNTKEELARAHQKKTERLPKMVEAMQDLLVTAAAGLPDVPDNEEVALGMSLFYWHGEDRSGLPDQIVIHGQKKALLAAAKDKTLLASAVRIEQY